MSPKSRYIHKSHNVSVLLYHIVYSTKYRRKVLSPKVEKILVKTCKEIMKRYEIEFLEIGTDKDHVHFLIQSVPMYSPTKIVRTIKSLTAREIFKHAPGVRRALWGGEFWSDGYYISTVGRHGTEKVIQKYVKEQGLEKSDYEKLYSPSQLKLF
ncbi:MAG: IS200/IS605 family transposase [Bacteroidota bacterium]